MEQGAKVYIPHGEEVWAACEVVEVLEGDRAVRVRLDKDGSEVEVPLSSGEPLPLQNTKPPLGSSHDDGAPVVGVADMCQLNYLHEPAILFNLKERFMNQVPYTYTGPICLAMNPYEWYPHLYEKELAKAYAVMEAESLPPHVYATAADAYRGLNDRGQDQSILVSGESGAGKTESVKIMMNMIAYASQRFQDSVPSADLVNDGQHDVVERVLKSNPLLESFGNAKTVRNDNSSRFGKFQSLNFDSEGRLVGSHCQTYLLEKSRVVSQAPQERNYHIFYQLLASSPELRQELGLVHEEPGYWNYTKGGDVETSVIEGETDEQRFHATVGALRVIGVKEGEEKSLLRALAGVLHLGQIVFTGDESASVEEGSQESLSMAASLLGCSTANELSTALCIRHVKARNEEIQVPMTPSQAVNAREALAKEVYGRLFLWLIKRINRSTATAHHHHGQQQQHYRGSISLLDIFGFENFAVNSFEQLCINLANEKLQQRFTMDIFKSVQQEYEEEGIPWSHIDFKDNTEVLALFEGRMGIISVLNEECVRPKGNDESFCSKLLALHSEHPHLEKRNRFSSVHFTVLHYAGPVEYLATSFLEKNRDTLQDDLAQLLGKSQSEVVAELFDHSSILGEDHPGPFSPRSHKKPIGAASASHQTVATKFKAQLAHLMGVVAKTEVRYVRCIKPNSVKAPRIFEHQLVTEQLRYAGVVEGIRISRAAYPNRMLLHDFFTRFWVLLPKNQVSSTQRWGHVEGADMMRFINVLLPDSSVYEVGKTRIYFRTEALEKLEEERGRFIRKAVVAIQRIFRGWQRRRVYHMVHHYILVLQSCARGTMARRSYLHTRRSIILIQCQARGRTARRERVYRKREASALVLQRYTRRWCCNRKYQEVRQKAIVLQSWTRMWVERRRYLGAVAEAREQAKLENQLEALKRRLEEEVRAKEKIEKEHRKAQEEIQRMQEAVADQQQQQQVVVQPQQVVLEPVSAAGESRVESKEMLETLERLRKENQNLRRENEGLKVEVASLKHQVTNVQAQNSTLEQKLASVVWDSKHQTKVHGVKSMSAEEKRAPAPLPKNCRPPFSLTEPLSGYWENASGLDLRELAECLEVHIKNEGKYLFQEDGFLKWQSMDRKTGYQRTSAFVIEKVPSYLEPDEIKETLRALGLNGRFVLRCQASKRYVGLGDMFSRYRLKCKDKGYDQAARFVFLPLIKSDEESPAEGSAYNAQGGWLPLEERKHYFTLQVLQPGKDPLVMQLTGDHFITMTVVSGTHKWGPSDFLVSTFAMEIPEKGGMWERGNVSPVKERRLSNNTRRRDSHGNTKSSPTKVVLKVQVEMGGGKHQEFFLREGEDLSKSIRSFCHKNGVEREEVIAGLEQSIRLQAPPEALSDNSKSSSNRAKADGKSSSKRASYGLLGSPLNNHQHHHHHHDKHKEQQPNSQAHSNTFVTPPRPVRNDQSHLSPDRGNASPIPAKWSTARGFLQDLKVEESIIAALEADGVKHINGLVDRARDSSGFDDQMMKLGLKKGAILTIKGKLRKMEGFVGPDT